MNKKGDQIVLNLFATILLIVFIFFSYMYFVNGLKDQTNFKHQWLGEDLRLLTGALQASPGKVRGFAYAKESFPLEQYRYEYADTLAITRPTIAGEQKKVVNRFTYYDSKFEPLIGRSLFAPVIYFEEKQVGFNQEIIVRGEKSGS